MLPGASIAVAAGANFKVEWTVYAVFLGAVDPG
jgi:hypothetical protein